MSLINDALKKAQRQRENAAPPAGAGTPPAEGSNVSRIPKRRQPLPARTLMLLVTGGILLLVTGGGIAIVLFNLDTTPPAPIKVVAARRPVPAPPVLPAPISVSMPPAKPVAPAPSPPAVVTPIAPVPPAPIVPPPQPPAVPVVPAANPAANLFLDAMRVTGVRVDGADSKIIMNDRVVRLGELVDPSTGLRLVQITISDLVFTDATGFKYDKPLP